MQGVLEGFAVIGAVIALGVLLAHLEVLGADAQRLMLRLVFYVATPALLFRLLSEADVRQVFSSVLAVAALSVVAVVAIYLVLARWWWRRETGEATVGALTTSYVNAGNLGLPIAAYVLGDGALIAPVLLMQLILITPIAFAVLDAATSQHGPSLVRALRQPFTNPITVGAVLGVLMALTGWSAPLAVTAPLDLVGAMAVPGALLAYGMALRLGPRPMAAGSTSEVVVASALKLLGQPITAYLLGRYAFGLDGPDLLAVTVVAALPTAQNIYVYASLYDRSAVLARDVIFVTTLLSFPVLVVVAALLG